ncbi:MAG TPA: hypothetical protein VGC54_00160 [Planctomycetota bacterium]
MAKYPRQARRVIGCNAADVIREAKRDNFTVRTTYIPKRGVPGPEEVWVIAAQWPQEGSEIDPIPDPGPRNAAYDTLG